MRLAANNLPLTRESKTQSRPRRTGRSAFPLGRVARCCAHWRCIVTDEVRPPSVGVTAVRTFAILWLAAAAAIAFPLGKVARCGAARTVTDEGRPPAAGVLGTAVISECSSVGLYPAAHRAAYFPLCYAIFFTLSRFILQNLKIFFKNLLTK